MVARSSHPADRPSLPDQLRLGRRARFSRCHRYRWWLERVWDPAAPRLLFIGLNPSRADADRDDPTLRRLVGFARGWGFGGLEVVNLFARVGALPAQLRQAGDPVGPGNDRWIRHCLAHSSLVWLGWGNHGSWQQRDQQVLRLLRRQSVPLAALGLTRSGSPLHPLYRPAGLPLRRLAPSWAHAPQECPASCPVSLVVSTSICC